MAGIDRTAAILWIADLGRIRDGASAYDPLRTFRCGEMDKSFRFEIEERETFVKLTGYGVATVEDCKKLISAISKDGVYVFARRLYDLNECRLELSGDDIKSLADLSRPLDPSQSRIAVVASEDLNYGLARMHAVFREHDNFSIRAFRDEDEAIRWLVS